MNRKRIKRVSQLIGKILLGLLLLCITAAVVFVYFILPHCPIGSDVPPFYFDRKMNIAKQTPDGVPYTVNNSTATFKLDLAEPDAQSEMIFTNYTSALKYCQQHGLPTIPSVQVIQGKLKSFDDSLCAALELAMCDQRNHILMRLLEALKPAGPSEAIVHIAAALSLAGVEPDVDASLLQQVQVAKEWFLKTPAARPIGFWDGNERLQRNFQSDRFLMQGFKLHDSPGVCIAISQAIMGDETLKSEFKQIWEFGVKLTNPSSTVPFDKVANLTPEQIRQRFPSDAQFAVIAYSTSKENSLIDRCVREGKVEYDTDLMALIIDAIRGGRLSLEPQPDSGWYDYQWHALETLLAPERGMESAKLHLSEAYKKRLEGAFASALTKQRETHIKRLPVSSLGMADGQDKPAPKVAISPEFSAEPTLTVYLRLARGYRFLRQAMQATLGEEKFSEIRRPSADCSMDAELQAMAWFCYGLYEKLCLEIGRVPVYLPDELSETERAAAIAVFDAWKESWLADPLLALDTRVAAPIGEWDDGSVVYWGTAGVRLQAASYKYLDKPEISGKVEPEFVSAKYYLPTDIFLEFKRTSPERLTRAEFRTLCDSCPDMNALHQTLGIAPASASGTQGDGVIKHWIRSNWGWAIVVIGLVLFWRVRRTRRWLILGVLAVAVSWGCLFVLSPFYRTKFMVRHVATINGATGSMCEMLMFKISAAPRVLALSELLSDPDAQIRYLAARFMLSNDYFNLEPERAAESNAWFQAEIKERLLQAANDPDPEIASLVLLSLRPYHDSDVADFLLAKLESVQTHDEMCIRVIQALAETGDPRAIKAIRPLCEDPRTVVSLNAIWVLKKLPQPEVLEHLLQLSESPVSHARVFALGSLKSNYYLWCDVEKDDDEVWSLKCDEMLLQRVRQRSLPFDVLLSATRILTHDEIISEAQSIMIESANSSVQSNQIVILKASPYLRGCGSSRNDYELMQGVITNAPERVELAEAIKNKNTEAFKGTLATIFTEAASSPDESIRRLSKIFLEKFKDEESDEPRSSRRSRRRR